MQILVALHWRNLTDGTQKNIRNNAILKKHINNGINKGIYFYHLLRNGYNFSKFDPVS